MKDLSDTFIEYYLEGKIQKALTVFNWKESLVGWKYCLRNFADALCWGSQRELYLQVLSLKEQLPKEYVLFSDRISQDSSALLLLQYSSSEWETIHSSLSEDRFANLYWKLNRGELSSLDAFPSSMHEWYDSQFRMIDGMQRFSKAHPKIWDLFSSYRKRPLLALDYPNLYVSLPNIFVFKHPCEFYHALSNPSVVDVFCQPNAFFFMYGIHPSLQLERQRGIPQLPFPSTCLDAIHKFCLEERECNTLERLQGNGVFSLVFNHTFTERKDPYKEPVEKLPLSIYLKEWENRGLKRLKKQRVPHFSHSRRRIAHVVFRIGDESNHAPSKILETILTRHDRALYDVYVISLEQGGSFLWEYPMPTYCDRSSLDSAPKRIEMFEKLGIKVCVLPESKTYFDGVMEVIKLFTLHEIEIACFHECPPMVSMLVTLLDNPYKVFIDHGTRYPTHGGFDLMVISNLKESGIDVGFYENLGSRLVDIPMVAAITPPRHILTKERLGFDKQCVLLATVSNYLEERLSPRMLEAIVEILKGNPNTYYVLIGPIKSLKVAKFFRDRKVLSKVKFLDSVQDPIHTLSCIDIYLTEFPHGGSIAVQEAMGAKCAIVTLYSEEGDPQARYAGKYIGVEHAVRTVKEYIDFTNELIRNPILRKKFSEHCLNKFYEFVQPDTYVHALERALSECGTTLSV